MIRLNPKKNIGRVIYIVEGERKEINILRHVFTKILNYKVVVHKRNDKEFKEYESYQSKSNEFSEIFVINSSSSSLKSIDSNIENQYLDNVIDLIYHQFGVSPENAAVYYVFDKDRNDEELIKRLLDRLSNARDNGFEPNGLLLLSYPSIESFIISCYDGDTRKLSVKSKYIKKYLHDKGYQQDTLNQDNIKQSFDNLKTTLEDLLDSPFIVSWLDDFSKYNNEIFDEQCKNYNESYTYRLLSLLALSFLDLGIITIE